MFPVQTGYAHRRRGLWLRFGMGRRDEAKLDALVVLPYTILFLDGNHECFHEIFAYPEEMWNGGRIRRIRPNALHLMRGQVL